MKTFKLLFASFALLLVSFYSKGQTWNIPAGTGGSLNTFIGTTDASDLVIRTTNVNRAKFFGTGTYAGSLKLYSNNFTFGNSGTSFFNWPSSGHLYFSTLTDTENPGTGTTRMILTNDGKLGIGITPRAVAAMEIYKASNPSFMINSSTAMAYFALATGDYNWSGSALNNDAVLSTNPGATGNLLLQTRSTGKAIKFVTQFGGHEGVKMMVNHDGNVGIGTISVAPTAKLEIRGQGNATDRNVLLKLSNEWNGNSTALNEPTLLFDNGGGTVGWFTGAQVSGSSYYRIGQYQGAAPATFSEYFRINDTGKVGIGTTNFIGDHKLYVGGGIISGDPTTFSGGNIQVNGNGAWGYNIESRSNNSTTPTKLFVGTNTNWNNTGTAREVFYVNSLGHMSLRSLSIGTNCTNDYMFNVNGAARFRKIRVDVLTWCDYVFAKNYKLSPLSEVEKYIEKNQHLPDVPSEAEVMENGMDVSDMNAILLKKVEELYLYTIEQEKRLKQLESQIIILTQK